MSGELFGTELTTSSALRTRIPQMILHQHARYHSTAVARARNGIVFASVQMCFQLAKLVRPLATLFVVNAVHHRTHDGFLRLRIRIDLYNNTRIHVNNLIF